MPFIPALSYKPHLFPTCGGRRLKGLIESNHDEIKRESGCECSPSIKWLQVAKNLINN